MKRLLGRQVSKSTSQQVNVLILDLFDRWLRIIIVHGKSRHEAR